VVRISRAHTYSRRHSRAVASSERQSWESRGSLIRQPIAKDPADSNALSLLASPSWSNRLMSILLVPLGHSKRLPGAVRPFVPLRGLREFTLCRGHDSHVQTMFVHADRRTSCSTLLPFPPPIVEFRVQRQTRGPASTFPSWSLRGKPLKILRVPSQGIHRDPPTVPLIINIQHHHR
jgi:hypothetical protein